VVTDVTSDEELAENTSWLNSDNQRRV